MGDGPATPVPCNIPACPGDPRAHPAALSLLSLQRCGAKQGRERQQATGCPLPVQGPPKSWPRRTSSPTDTDSSVPQEGTWPGRTQHLPGTGRRAAGSEGGGSRSPPSAAQGGMQGAGGQRRGMGQSPPGAAPAWAWGQPCSWPPVPEEARPRGGRGGRAACGEAQAPVPGGLLGRSNPALLAAA